MQATVVVIGTFKNGYEAVFVEYSRKVREFLIKQQAVVIRRQMITQTLYGVGRPNLVMVVDFPSRRTAETCFYQQEHLDLIPLRAQVFTEFQMYLAPFWGALTSQPVMMAITAP